MPHYFYCLVLLSSLCFQEAFCLNEVQKSYGLSEIVPADLAFPGLEKELNKNIKRSDSQFIGNVCLVVASKNPLKLEAAKGLFELNPRFKHAIIQVIGFNSPSEIAEQPLGWKNAAKGAINRLTNAKEEWEQIEAKEQSSAPVFFCAIENFISVASETGLARDHAYVLIENNEGELFHYISDGVSIARELYEAAIKEEDLCEDGTGSDKTLGSYLERQFNLDPASWQAALTRLENEEGKVLHPGLSRIGQILSVSDSDYLF